MTQLGSSEFAQTWLPSPISICVAPCSAAIPKTFLNSLFRCNDATLSPLGFASSPTTKIPPPPLPQHSFPSIPSEVEDKSAMPDPPLSWHRFASIRAAEGASRLLSPRWRTIPLLPLPQHSFPSIPSEVEEESATPASPLSWHRFAPIPAAAGAPRLLSSRWRTARNSPRLT